MHKFIIAAYYSIFVLSLAFHTNTDKARGCQMSGLLTRQSGLTDNCPVPGFGTILSGVGEIWFYVKKYAQ